MTHRVADVTPCNRYEPPVPTFSAAAGATGSVVSSDSFTITAVFDKPVTGVAPSDFGLTSSNAAVGITSSVASTDNLNWVLTVSAVDAQANTDVTVSMPANSGAITNKNAAATNNGFQLLYRPPTATLTTSSTTGTTPESLSPITATFGAPVSGVTAADFNGGTPFPVEAGVSYAVTGSGTEWVLTVTLDDDARATKALSFSMAPGSGSISPAPAASTGTLTLT